MASDTLRCIRTYAAFLAQQGEPLYQLFVIMKSGEKTGYLSTDYPQFSLDGEVVHFTTNELSFDIAKEELECFTLEQVLPEHPTAISMPDELKVGLGRTARLDYALTPADAQTTVTWFNTDEEVATVSPQGLVTAHGVGTTQVTVQTSNGLRASCQVTVPEPQWKLFLWLQSGEIEAFDLAEHPEVTLGTENLTLTTDNTCIEYPIDDILHFTMSDAALYNPADEIATGVQPSDAVAAGPLFHAGDVTFDRLGAGSPVRVYDTSGRLLHETVADGQGHLRLSLRTFGRGVFIIKTETSTFKIHQQ